MLQIINGNYFCSIPNKIEYIIMSKIQKQIYIHYYYYSLDFFSLSSVISISGFIN